MSRHRDGCQETDTWSVETGFTRITTAAIMQKNQALAVMGQRSLLMPGFIKAALAANDHLKLYLSVLQAAAAHAEHPAIAKCST